MPLGDNYTCDSRDWKLVGDQEFRENGYGWMIFLVKILVSQWL